MGTLASELSPHVPGIAGQPRVYVDANMPARLVSLMRTLLKWDVLFVMEHDDLRRATDRVHFLLARQLQRTLVTLDRDYLDARKFPPAEGAGVLVLTAPNENGLAALLKRLDREAFRAAADTPALPFAGHTLHVQVDWRATPR
jgi:predicted nuclease of predicted toxin-antitoxin system